MIRWEDEFWDDAADNQEKNMGSLERGRGSLERGRQVHDEQFELYRNETFRKSLDRELKSWITWRRWTVGFVLAMLLGAGVGYWLGVSSVEVEIRRECREIVLRQGAEELRGTVIRDQVTPGACARR